MAGKKQITQFWKAQKVAFESGPAPFLFMGGVGSGKSLIGIYKMLYLLDMYPGSRGAIIRQRSTQLKKTIAATLWQLLDTRHVARRNDNEGYIQLKNTSELHFRHLDKATSIDDLKSFEINFAMVDQAEDISSEAFDTLVERVGRWTGATKRGGWPDDWPYVTDIGEKIPPPYVFMTAYSPGYDHWITNRFWEHGEERERYRKEGYSYVIGSTRDNKALTKQYLKGRLAMGSEYVRRYVDAVDWGATEGRIFKLSEKSILEPTPELLGKIHHQMRRHRVMDHGDFAPVACLWYATDSDHNIYYYREYMQGEKLVSEHRKAIYDLSCQDGPGGNEPPRYHSQYADPSIFNKSRGRTATDGPKWSVADEWSDKRMVDMKTAIYWRKAINDEAATIARVKEYLREDFMHKHPVTGERGAPRMYFIVRTADYPHGIHETLVDIRNARRIEVGQNVDGTKQYGEERDEKVRDHLLDTIRYSAIMRPALGRRQDDNDVPDGHIRLSDYYRRTEEEEGQREIDDNRRPMGGYGY